MSRKSTNIELGEGLEKDRTDWNRLDAMTDDDIDTSDIPMLDQNFFKNAKVVMPPEKKAREHSPGQRCAGVDEISR